MAEWMNSFGERVVETRTGLTVLNSTGKAVLRPAGTNARTFLKQVQDEVRRNPGVVAVVDEANEAVVATYMRTRPYFARPEKKK